MLHSRQHAKSKGRNLIDIWLPLFLTLLQISGVLFALAVPPSFAAEVTMEVYQQSDGKVFGKETSLDIFNNPKLGGKKLVAPFTVGSYTFCVYNNSNSRLLPYSLSFLTENEENIPLIFSLQKNGQYIYGGESEMLPLTELNLSKALLGGRKTDLYTIKWRWDTKSDTTDTALGNRAAGGETLLYSLTIKAVGTINELPESGIDGSDIDKNNNESDVSADGINDSDMSADSINESDAARNKASESNIPKTGAIHIMIWLLICCTALVLVFLLFICRKRRNNEIHKSGY